MPRHGAEGDRDGPRKRPFLAPAALLLLWGWPLPAQADELVLKNGDRLTGEIVKMEEQLLSFRTSYSGELLIDWKEVQSLTSDKPLTIQLLPDVIGPTAPDAVLLEDRKKQARTIGPGEVLTPGEVKAINIPKVRMSGNIAAGGNSTGGNTDTKALNASTRWTIRTERHRVLLEGKYNYAEAGSRVTARNSMASVKYDYFLSKALFFNLEELLEKDTFQNLFLRSTTGAGLGLQVLDFDMHKLAVIAGLAYVHEDYTTVPTTQTPTARWNVRWEYTVIPKILKLWHKHEGYRDFLVRDALRVNADQGVRVTLYENLFLNVEYDIRYNTRPAPGRLPTDEAFIFGIGYDFSN